MLLKHVALDHGHGLLLHNLLPGTERRRKQALAQGAPRTSPKNQTARHRPPPHNGPYLSRSLVPARLVRAISPSKFCRAGRLTCRRPTRGRTTS